MWPAPPESLDDRRLRVTGLPIPTQFYADQPFLTPTLDGGLLCAITTGLGHEGSRGQHVLVMKTFDGGKTWQDETPLESPNAPEASWGVPITLPSGRVFVFYIFNADDIRELPADDPPYPGGVTRRMDSHGHYVFRWSDDHGKTWSSERGVIPVREFEIDRKNPSGGAVRLFWNVSKPFLMDGSIFLPIHKVGGFGDGWFTSSEGGLLRSDDLVQCDDPRQATWETLPDGDQGIRSPVGGGPIAEEHSFVPLSDGSIFTVFRTIDGHPGCAYSRDGGHSWEPSEYMRFANGQLMKHPRAATFVWKRSDGGYLYFFHNHGGQPLRDRTDRRSFAYTGRNPIWFCRGWEVDAEPGKRLAWSQPEVGFYDDDPLVRLSYPDFLEWNGELLFTQTQKSQARIHVIPPQLADALSADPNVRLANLKTLQPAFRWDSSTDPRVVPMPELPRFVVRDPNPPYGGKRLRRGFAVRMTLQIQPGPSAVIAEHLSKSGGSIRITRTDQNSLRLELSDGESAIFADSDPLKHDSNRQVVTINIDGGSNTICFFLDGTILDGGDRRQYGWSRLSPHYRNEFSGGELVFPCSDAIRLESFQIFDRPLMAAEIAALDTDAKIA